MRPTKDDSLVQVRYGIIGAGAVSDFHHVPGIDLDPRAKLVMVADPVEACVLFLFPSPRRWDTSTSAAPRCAPASHACSRVTLQFCRLLDKRVVDWAPIRITKDYKELLADPEIDAVREIPRILLAFPWLFPRFVLAFTALLSISSQPCTFFSRVSLEFCSLSFPSNFGPCR